MSDRRPAEDGEEHRRTTARQYLTTRQYRDASNLNARGSLHARFTTNPYPWFRWLFDQLLTLAPTDACILEVGAGPASLWTENLDRLPPRWRITLTDLSDGMVAIARSVGRPIDEYYTPSTVHCGSYGHDPDRYMTLLRQFLAA